MEAIQAKNKQKSDRMIAEELLVQYQEYDRRQKESVSEKKAIEKALLELSEKHFDWFDGKTAQFANGQLKWSAVSKVAVSDDFDMGKFRKNFPHLVKVREDIVLAALRPYLNDPRVQKYGIAIESEDKFKVVV